MRRLPASSYLAFPLRIGTTGSATSQRRDHVREQIQQVIGTAAGERVFRQEFGAGLRRLLFEPNGSAMWDLARKRLSAALAEALQGDVDPRTLEISVDGLEPGSPLAQETVRIHISYRLAALGERDEFVFDLGERQAPHG